MIANLARYREWYKLEDDFGFSNTAVENGSESGHYLADLLKDGPPAGIHTLI